MTTVCRPPSPVSFSPPPKDIIGLSKLGRLGEWVRRHGSAIRLIQWVIVLAYAILLIIPAIRPLPSGIAHVWTNLTLFAQFAFWGIWWPFVLLSMVVIGRAWCGVLCPEGTLTEFASRHGLGRAIPHWLRWGGWPFVAFGLTTLYGQMVSVYQYPKAVLVVLGGSTVAAMIIGFIYGREKRVWCKYLCPVNGVFGLLSRLAPLHFKVDEEAWRRSYKTHVAEHPGGLPVNCAPLVPLRHMKGGAQCHMCGRCSGYRGAIALSSRSPSSEIVDWGGKQASTWDSALILYGLMGIAIGAFHWTMSPWFIALKQMAAGWLVEHDILWPLATNAPWFILTHYPDQNDIFSWLDGGIFLVYALTTALIYGTLLSLLLAAATRSVGAWSLQRFNHITQALIPLAGCGVFIGLSATTVTILRAEHINVSWVPALRFALLLGSTLWSAWLAWRVLGRYTASWKQRVLGLGCVTLALAWANSAWVLMFYLW